MNEKFCQSCGMPMGNTDEMYGTEKDGSKSLDYCHYCYDKGEFKADMKIEEMINLCIPHMLEANKSMTEEDARNMMNQFFPTLKRWKQN